MAKLKIDDWTIRRDDFGGHLALVYSDGYVYATRFAPDAQLNEEVIRRSWRENRHAWLPYDESTGQFI